MTRAVTMFLLFVVLIFVSIHYADLGQPIESNNEVVDATHSDIRHQWTTVSESTKEKEETFLIIPSTKNSSAQYGTCEDYCGQHSNGCSLGNGQVSCNCRFGYVQRDGVCEVACGTLRECENGGNCQKKLCSCIQGTHGHFCEIIEDCMSTCPNDNLTYCGFDGKLKTPYCKCRDETLGYDPEKQVCRKSCSTCENGGLCQVSGYSSFCKCINGTSGDSCQEVPDCALHKNLCKDESKCYFDVERKTAACECPDKIKAYDRRTGKCRRTCDNDVCENGGICDYDPLSDSSFCKCFQGTSGDHCEEVNDCELHRNFCKDESKCYFNVDRKKVECQCPDEKMIYDRRMEKCRIECKGLQDCVNGGRCERGLCVCYSGTSGTFCEIIEKCEDLCPNLGQTNCAYDVRRKKPYCECYSKELGYDSEKQMCKKTCGNDECENGGECQVLGYSMFCKCLAGTSGDLCQKVDDCAPGKKFCKDGAKCYFDVDRKSVDCECPDDKMAYDIRSKTCRRTCDNDVCKNGGTCLTHGTSKFCTCFYGTSGDYCEEIQGCLPHNNFCKDKSVCYFDVESKEAACKCQDRNMDYDEDSEKCRVSCNNDIPCKNNGKCTGSDVKFCRCKPGTGGDLCERVDSCEVPDFCGKKPGVTCVFDYQELKGVCLCEDGRKKFHPITKECKRTCSISEDCSNGGTCVEFGDKKFCECFGGTSGELCEIVNDCESKIRCKDGSVCEFDVATREVVCGCKDAGKQYDLMTESCKKTCDETNIKCRNGGSCGGTGGLRFCKCLSGTKGDLCDIVDECEKNPNKCKDGAECVFDIENEEAECKCEDDSEQYDPLNEICKKTKSDPCASNPCQNGGQCNVDNNNVATCNCSGTFIGTFCDTDACNPNLCQNDGVCSVENSARKCKCKQPFSGELCEIETECTCFNGNCKIVSGKKVCSCFEGYALEGDNCKQLTCSKTACINGTCLVRHGNAEVCLCGAGFTLVEDTCKRGICRIDTCYGGKCEAIEGELVCVCKKGFHLDGVGCYATQCKEQTCFGGKCVVKDNKEICRCKEGYVLINNVCKKVLCEDKSCFGGQCHLVDGKEKCSCPVGFTIYDDVCREDLLHYRSQLLKVLLSNKFKSLT